MSWEHGLKEILGPWPPSLSWPLGCHEVSSFFHHAFLPRYTLLPLAQNQLGQLTMD